MGYLLGLVKNYRNGIFLVIGVVVLIFLTQCKRDFEEQIEENTRKDIEIEIIEKEEEVEQRVKDAVRTTPDSVRDNLEWLRIRQGR